MKIKKNTILLIAMFILFGTSMSVSAESPSVTAEVNYLQNTIDVSYSSELLYNTAITFVLTRSDAVNSSENYLRITEVDFTPGKSADCQISFGDDIDCREGVEHCETYKIYAVPGGLKSNEFKAVSDDFVICCAEKQAELLVGVNTKAESEALDNCKAILNTFFGKDTTDADNSLGKYLKKMQSDDYNGNYTSIGQLPEAWKISNVLLQVNAAQDSDSLKTVISDNSEILNIVNDDEFYKMDIDGVYKRLFKLLSAEKVYSLKAFSDKMAESIAISSFNKACKSNLEKLDLIFEKLSKNLGISDADMVTYRKLKSNDKKFVLNFERQFDRYSEESPTAIAEKFKGVLSKFIKNDTSGGGGSSGGSGGGTPTVRGEENAYGSGTMNAITSQNENNKSEVKGFRDLPQSHWAYQYVTELCNYGVISGYDDGSFRPEAQITRGEFIKIITESMNINSSNNAQVSFIDVKPADWVYPYVQRLAAIGAINGYEDGSCGVRKNISREEASVFIERVLKIKNITFIEADDNGFVDEGDIAEYAKEAVKTLSGAGIISGFEDGRFMPKNNLTRAQAAVIIYRAVSK